MSNNLVKEMTDEEKILKQGFKMGATAAFGAANYPLDNITDELLDNMYDKIIRAYASKMNPQ